MRQVAAGSDHAPVGGVLEVVLARTAFDVAPEDLEEALLVLRSERVEERERRVRIRR